MTNRRWAASWTFLLALVGSSVATSEEIVGAGDPGTVLEEVLAPYRQLEGLHYQAHFLFTFWDADGRESFGESSAEYWGSPVGLRSETEVDRRLTRAGFPGGQIVTFDGLESRILFKENGLLALQRGEMPDSALTPNLIFLPIDFLKQLCSEPCFCRPTLADIRSSSVAATYLPEGSSIRPVQDDPESVEIVLPATEEAARTEISLARREGFWFVRQVVLRDAEGALTSRHRFAEPILVPGAPAGFAPARTVVMEGWARDGELPNGAVHLEIRGEITQLELNPTFYWGEFSIPIDTDLAQTVVDNDTGKVPRAWSCRLPLPERLNPFDAP